MIKIKTPFTKNFNYNKHGNINKHGLDNYYELDTVLRTLHMCLISTFPHNPVS
jgi:hypothetical protein